MHRRVFIKGVVAAVTAPFLFNDPTPTPLEQLAASGRRGSLVGKVSRAQLKFMGTPLEVRDYWMGGTYPAKTSVLPQHLYNIFDKK